MLQLAEQLGQACADILCGSAEDPQLIAIYLNQGVAHTAALLACLCIGCAPARALNFQAFAAIVGPFTNPRTAAVSSGPLIAPTANRCSWRAHSVCWGVSSFYLRSTTPNMMVGGPTV